MASTERLDYRTDIEGLRGIAVLLVVLFHAGVSVVKGAFVAVDVFFVLSGFFLTSQLVREIAVDGRADLTTFYARRMLRLLPVFLLVLLATLASAMLLFAPIDRPGVASDIRPVVFFAGNLWFASEGVNYFSNGENPLLHTWSLGVEQQFHLAWPLILMTAAWIATRRAVRGARSDNERLSAVRGMLVGIALAALLSFALSWLFSHSAPMWSYFGPHTRLWEFALGGAAAMIAGPNRGLFGDDRRTLLVAQGIGFAAIASATFLYDSNMPYPGAAALLPVFGAVLLLTAGNGASNTPLGKLLSLPQLRWFGRVSYAWYLWHWPVMVLGGVLVPDIGVKGRLVCGAIALVLSWLTLRFIETPIRRGSLNAKPAETVFFGATLASLAVFVVAQVALSKAERDVRQPEQRVFADAREDRMSHSCWVRSVDALPKTPCVFGDATSRTTFVLLGDSHAEHWLGGLDRAGKAHGWKVVANVMGGCPVADFSRLTSRATSRRYAECSRYREQMLTRIIAEKPSAVILSSYDHYVPASESDASSWNVSPDAWQQGLRRTYSRLAAAGIPVVVIRGTPRTWFDVPACLSRKAAGLPFSRDCTYEFDYTFVAAAQNAQDVAARGLDIRFVDMNDQICAGARCPTVRNGIVMFTDDNHLTASFTKSLAPVLGARIANALGTTRAVQTSRAVQLRVMSRN